MADGGCFSDKHDDTTTPSQNNEEGNSNRSGEFYRSRRDRKKESHSVRSGGGRVPKLHSGWYKVTISNGRNYTKEWLVTALQNICSYPYTPVQYHVGKTRAYFYVDDSAAAIALRKCYRKIRDTDGNKVKVYVNPCAPPSCLPFYPNPEHLEHLKQCIVERYDASQRALNLNNIQTDPDLVSKNIDIVLTRKTLVETIIKFIDENIPEVAYLNLTNNRIHKLDELSELVSKMPNLVKLNLSHNGLKTIWELDKVKGLKLSELWLIKNPLCDLFKDQTEYINAVRQRFPQLLKLDGHDLTAPIGLDVKTPTTNPSCKGSVFGLKVTKYLALQFLQQYYRIYDSGNRQPLFDAYIDGAILSFTTTYSTQNPLTSNIASYSKDSQKETWIKYSMMPFQLVTHSRPKIVAFLQALPKTLHDTALFVNDVNIYSDTLLSITVSGIFKEVGDGTLKESTKAFTRVFTTVSADKTGLGIVNDQLFIRSPTEEEISSGYVSPVPTTSSRPAAIPTTPEQEMDLSL